MFIKIVFTGLSLCIINIFLKKQLSEFILPSEIVFLAFATALAIDFLQENFSYLSEIISRSEYGDEVFSSAIKGAGICLITKFSSDICNENGNRLIADVIELTGRVMLLIIAMPYIESIMKTAFAFIK